MKKEQQVIITANTYDVNKYLENGWLVVSVTPNHTGAFTNWCFVIERDKK
jgi:hypothetical protein